MAMTQSDVAKDETAPLIELSTPKETVSEIISTTPINAETANVAAAPTSPISVPEDLIEVVTAEAVPATPMTEPVLTPQPVSQNSFQTGAFLTPELNKSPTEKESVRNKSELQDANPSSLKTDPIEAPSCVETPQENATQEAPHEGNVAPAHQPPTNAVGAKTAKKPSLIKKIKSHLPKLKKHEATDEAKAVSHQHHSIFNHFTKHFHKKDKDRAEKPYEFKNCLKK